MVLIASQRSDPQDDRAVSPADTVSAATAVSSSRCASFFTILSWIKMTLSMILILFSVVVVSAAIFTKQTDATAEYGVHPIVALAVFWGSLAWLAIMEGGLNCMVGLQPIPKSLYKTTHPKTYRCTQAAHQGENIERFIVGRQYLDLTIVFTTSFMVNAIAGAQVLGLPPVVNSIFLDSDLGVILCTIVFGQLISVINCTHNMLDFVNNWCMVGSTYLALCVEASGILHAVYLVQIIFTKLANRSKNNNSNNKTKKRFLKRKQSDVMEKDSSKTLRTADGGSTSGSSNEGISDDSSEEGASSAEDAVALSEDRPTKPLWRRVLFWARVAFSMAISVFAVVVFAVALANGNTTLRADLPVPVSIVCLLILLLLGGFMEALQIAFFAVKHLDQAKIEANPTARRNCKLLLSNEGSDGSQYHNRKLQAFLIGRQIAQTVIMFMIARIISVDMKVEGQTLFGVPPIVQKVLFDSGLLNALVTTIFASLSWRVTANFFPMLYLGSPISIWIIRLCLLVEASGICDAAWILAKIPAIIVGIKSDESYLADARMRMAQQQEGSVDDVETGNHDTGTRDNNGAYRKQSTMNTESIDSSPSREGRCHASQGETHDEC